MKRHLATEKSIEAHQNRRRKLAGRDSVAPSNAGLTKREVVDSVKGLKRSGYKIPAKLKAKVPQD